MKTITGKKMKANPVKKARPAAKKEVRKARPAALAARDAKPTKKAAAKPKGR